MNVSVSTSIPIRPMRLFYLLLVFTNAFIASLICSGKVGQAEITCKSSGQMLSFGQFLGSTSFCICCKLLFCTALSFSGKRFKSSFPDFSFKNRKELGIAQFGLERPLGKVGGTPKHLWVLETFGLSSMF